MDADLRTASPLPTHKTLAIAPIPRVLTTMQAFKALGLSADLLHGVEVAGYTEPTPIQQRAIPVVLSGRSLVASAQTGTGKTAAFVLPILQRLRAHRAGAPRVLVLEPTRELARQVEEVFHELGRGTDLSVTVLHGGVGLGRQRDALAAGTDVVISTTGRLMELISEKSIDLSRIEVLVLDEVDRMLDMGFVPDVKTIVPLCPRSRQTLFFTATMPKAIERVAKFAVQNPARIVIDRQKIVTDTVAHSLFPVVADQKLDLLLALLQRIDYESVLIFTRTKQGADDVVRQLKAAKHKVTVLHSDRSQGQRNTALRGFKDGTYPLLVATDIAARGLDITGVSHVINYDVPNNCEDYVHRIGRTGRAMTEGDAFTLATPEERGIVHDIEAFIGSRIKQISLPGFDYEGGGPPRVDTRNPARKPRRGSVKPAAKKLTAKPKASPAKAKTPARGRGRAPAARSAKPTRPAKPARAPKAKPRRRR